MYECDEELKNKITDLYRYMRERNMGKIVTTFDSGNEFEIEIREKPIHIDLNEVLGEIKV